LPIDNCRLPIGVKSTLPQFTQTFGWESEDA